MRALQPVYVGCVQWLPESNEKYTPETPTPWVNGQVLSAPALQSSRSMFSFAPATTMFGWFASIAIAGSFCLFCENGDGLLPVLTSASVPGAAPASAATESAIPAASARVTNFVMLSSFSPRWT
ncbi:MAG: hypothetical protein E6G31_08530 [Actinobacteria bacterium]|nr:MAG: hypothetical protein E6G31_08530 [Actinomycetota bacterium]